jgi:radical SAM protein with 4Fe4S-binding SPASM domain
MSGWVIMGVEDADSHKLGLHPHQVSQWLRGRVMPMHAEIGLTNKCNHHCSFCTLDWITHGKETLASDVLGELMQDLKYMGVKSVYFAGEGEPTLHPEFVDVVNGTAHMGIKVAVATNGQRFTQDVAERTLRNISWIRFSLDTIDPTLYRQIHGVGNEALMITKNNIVTAVTTKKSQNLSVDIGVQVVLTEDTALTLNSTVEWLKKIGVDNAQIKPCHIHPNSSHSDVMDVDMYGHVQVEMKDYEADGFKVLVRTKSMNRLEQKRTYDRCNGFDFYALIAANGDVVPCNVFYRNPGFVYGNIYDKSLRDIWVSVRKHEIIKNIEKSCFSHCGDYRCRLDVMNRYLHRIKNPERNDVFI